MLCYRPGVELNQAPTDGKTYIIQTEGGSFEESMKTVGGFSKSARKEEIRGRTKEKKSMWVVLNIPPSSRSTNWSRP